MKFLDKTLVKTLGNTLYWIICIGSIILGGILFSVGISLGGASSFSIGPNGLVFYSGFSNYKYGNFEMNEFVITDLVDTIEIESDLSDIVFTSGDTLSVSYYGNINYKIKNNTLELDASTNIMKQFGFSMTTPNTSLIEITVPDYVINLEIDSSGKITISDLTLTQIDLETSLGDVLIEDTLAKHTDLKANLGNVTLNSCTFDTLRTELNMGALTTKKLDILSSANFENKMGTLDINLTKEESAYNFQNYANMGTLNINGNNNSLATGAINIISKTDMGSVTITTK